jgi:hypothetical protein
MKKIVLVLALICCFKIQAQIFTNAFRSDRLWQTQVFYDNQADIYVAGYDMFHTPQSDSGTIYKVIKYNPSGQELWRKEFSSPTTLYLYPGFSNGFLYLGGSFNTSICFANSCTVSAGEFDACLIKIDMNGTVMMNTEGSTGTEFIGGLAAVGNSVYVVGTVKGNINLANTSSVLPNDTGLVGLLNNNFNWSWKKWLPFGQYGLRYLKYSNGLLYSTSMYSGAGHLVELDLSGNLLTDYFNVSGNQVGDNDAFNLRQSNGNIVYMDCSYWHYSEWQMLKSMNSNQVTAWTQTANVPGLCDERSVLLKQGKLYWFNGSLIQANEQTGNVEFAGPLNQANIFYGFPVDYIGDDIILHGYFVNSLSIGNDFLTSDQKGHVFIALVNRNVILSDPQIGAAANFNIYPNPVTDILHLRSAIVLNKVTLYNTLGSKILEKEDASEIHVKNLPSGIYIVETENLNGQKHIEKIIKE